MFLFFFLCFGLQSSGLNDVNAASPRSEGRTIFYHVAEDNGEVDDEVVEGYSFTFKGNGLRN